MIKPLNLQLFADTEQAETAAAETSVTLDDVEIRQNQGRSSTGASPRRLKRPKDPSGPRKRRSRSGQDLEAEVAKMNAEQKAEHERLKRDKELADREALLTLRELRAEGRGYFGRKRPAQGTDRQRQLQGCRQLQKRASKALKLSGARRCRAVWRNA